MRGRSSRMVPALRNQLLQVSLASKQIMLSLKFSATNSKGFIRKLINFSLVKVNNQYQKNIKQIDNGKFDSVHTK